MLQVKSGEVWEGIFHALRPAGSDFDVLLRWAKPVPAAAKRTPDSWDDEQPSAAAAPGEWQPVRPQPLVTIAAADLVQISATDVRMGAADVGAAGGWDDAGGFGTDAAISRARGAWGRERELQRWTPDEGEGSHMLHLEEAVGHVERGWDQFAVRRAGRSQGAGCSCSHCRSCCCRTVLAGPVRSYQHCVSYYAALLSCSPAAGDRRRCCGYG